MEKQFLWADCDKHLACLPSSGEFKGAVLQAPGRADVTREGKKSIWRCQTEECIWVCFSQLPHLYRAWPCGCSWVSSQGDQHSRNMLLLVPPACWDFGLGVPMWAVCTMPSVCCGGNLAGRLVAVGLSPQKPCSTEGAGGAGTMLPMVSIAIGQWLLSPQGVSRVPGCLQREGRSWPRRLLHSPAVTVPLPSPGSGDLGAFTLQWMPLLPSLQPSLRIQQISSN